MKASELRIGNYVYDRGEKVLRIDYFEYIDADYNFKFGQKMYAQDIEVHPLTEYILYSKPIPLTKEWLEKFDLETDLAFDIVFENEVLTLKDENYFCTSKFYLNHIKYVHQLQNLYFALTGEELTLKEL